jgi:4-carboxymuconolactone decarboxylase
MTFARLTGQTDKCIRSGLEQVTEEPMPAKKMPKPRLAAVPEAEQTPAQKMLMKSISTGPRGQFKMSGPFLCYLQAPGFGELAQKLGAHVRFGTSVPPRLSEFAILCTAAQWKSQYEWVAHAVIAERQGVKPKTIADIRAGREPKGAPKDERAICAFVKELYKSKRVSDRAYKAVNALLGDAGTVELVGILGYYAMVAMTLDVFRMPVADGVALPFAEPAMR